MVPITNQLLRIIIIRITNQLLRIIIIIIRITNQLLRIIIILVPRRCPHLMHRIVLCRYQLVSNRIQRIEQQHQTPLQIITIMLKEVFEIVKQEGLCLELILQAVKWPMMHFPTVTPQILRETVCYHQTPTNNANYHNRVANLYYTTNPATNNVSPPNPNNANYHNHAANGYKTGMPRYVILQAI